MTEEEIRTGLERRALLPFSARVILPAIRKIDGAPLPDDANPWTLGEINEHRARRGAPALEDV